jgi:hypothetical protein
MQVPVVFGLARRCRTRLQGEKRTFTGHRRHGTRDIVPPMSATTRLAEFTVKTTLEDCPPEAVARARLAALDTLGVIFHDAK